MERSEMLRQYLHRYHLEALEQVLDEISLRQYAKGEYLCHAGDTVASFCILVDGKCKITPFSEDGKVVLLDYLEPVSFNGDIELLCGCDALYSVRAIEPTTVIVIPKSVFFHTVMEDSAFLKIMCERFAKKLHASSWNYSQMMLYPIKHRLCHYLLVQVRKQGTNRLNIKSAKLAQSMGITERHLRRVLNDLEEGGILIREQGVLDCDQEMLEQIGLFYS